MQKPAVKGEQMKKIEMLSLVFVQSLDLGIEKRIGINLQINFILNHLSQNDFIPSLDVHEFFLEGRIVGDFLQAAE